MVKASEEDGGKCPVDSRTKRCSVCDEWKVAYKLKRLLKWNRKSRTWINWAVIFLSMLNEVLGQADPTSDESGGRFSRQWAVHIEGGQDVADRIAEKHGFVNLGKIFEDFYHFEHKRLQKRSLTPHSEYHNNLLNEDQVKWAQQQVVKRRSKRDLLPFRPRSKSSNVRFNDVEWPQMWYLNRGQGLDMNVQGAWLEGISGKGVVVTILDDGLEKTHPDLVANYDPQASYDVNNHDEDPMPKYDATDSNRHGTRCAGEVAAVANNSLCSVGVAFGANVGGVRMLDGDVTDAVEARSLSLNPQHIDIYSASWGPDDDGKTVDGPGELATRAFMEGVTKGRQGKGSIFVWASGNGGREHDNCNCDGYTNSIWTLSISSATENGLVPWYSEACSSTLATTYSSGSVREKQIVTTDLRHKCTNGHTGTSASAPLAAGICALALEANRRLTWRDMQHIVVRTAKPANLKSPDWKVNGVGRNVSHSFGYGLMDATAMVKLARTWKTVPEQHQCEVPAPHVDKLIPARSKVILNLNVTECAGVNFLEHVQAKISLSSSRRGDLQIYLTSPAGTRSTLLARRPQDSSRNPFNAWPFMSVHTWGEMPFGIWQLEIHNEGRYLGRANLQEWSLLFYGTLQVPAGALDEIPSSTYPSKLSSDKSNGISYNLKFSKNALNSSGYSNRKNGKNWKAKSTAFRTGKILNATKISPTSAPKNSKTTQRLWYSSKAKDSSQGKGYARTTSVPLPPKHSLPLAIVLGPSGNFTSHHKVPDVFQKYSKVQQLFPLYVNTARVYNEENFLIPKGESPASKTPDNLSKSKDNAYLSFQKAERQNRFDTSSLSRAGPAGKKNSPIKTSPSRNHQIPGHFEGWQMIFYGTEDTPNGEMPPGLGKASIGAKAKNVFASKASVEDDVPNHLEPEAPHRGWKDQATRRDDVTRTTTDPLGGPSSGCASFSKSAQCVDSQVEEAEAYVRTSKTRSYVDCSEAWDPPLPDCLLRQIPPRCWEPHLLPTCLNFRSRECVSGLYLYEGRCEAICPPKTYPGTNAREREACMPCHYTCLTCAGETEAECTSCHDEAVPSPSAAAAAAASSDERLASLENLDEGVRVEDLPEENVRLSWGKRSHGSLVTSKSVLSPRAVTKKILEPYDSPKTLFYCYPARVIDQLQASYWYRRMTALFAVNLVVLIGIVLYFAWTTFNSRRKSSEKSHQVKYSYTKMNNGDSVSRLKDHENILCVSSSTEDEE